MKARTIKAVIRKKLDAWLDTIDDTSVRALASKNSIVTGGCIASMLLREKVNDFDLYFRDRETTLAVAEYYVAKFKENVGDLKSKVPTKLEVQTDADGRVMIAAKSVGVVSESEADEAYDYFEGRAPEAAGDYISEVMDDPAEIADKVEDVVQAVEDVDDSKPRYRPVFLSTNAITLSDKMQLVIRFYGEPDQIHENYDFVHCTNYYDSKSEELVLRKDALEALLSRELRYVGSKYPLCSLIRVRKFVGRGWTINAGQILKMCLQLNELDLKDFKVLRDQLTGVDVAYFAQLIKQVHEKDPEKVNMAYICEIIDRMF